MLLQTKTLNDTAPPFLTNEELNQLLLPIIDPQYQVNIKDWLYYAKPNEKKDYIFYQK